MTTGTAAVSASSNTSTTQNTINTSLAQIASNSQTFLTLLTTQMKNQDPLSPMDTNQFTQQLTQMSGVEQQLLGNQLLQTLVTEQGLNQGANLIGKTVTAPGAAQGDPDISGVVTGVQQVNGTTELIVGSKQIPLSSVISVANGSTATSTSGQGS